MLALNEILTYFSNPIKNKYISLVESLGSSANYLDYSQKEVIEAVIKFNIALIVLDETPAPEDVKTHILYGDLLLTEFYTTIAQFQNYTLLNDIVSLTKQSITKKSKAYEINSELSLKTKKQLYFTPILYLIDHGYLDHRVDQIIETFINNGDQNERKQ